MRGDNSKRSRRNRGHGQSGGAASDGAGATSIPGSPGDPATQGSEDFGADFDLGDVTQFIGPLFKSLLKGLEINGGAKVTFKASLQIKGNGRAKGEAAESPTET